MREGLRSSAMAVKPENVTVLEKGIADSGTSKGDGIASHGDNEKSEPELEPRNPPQLGHLPCPRCNGMDTKFIFYNSQKLSQGRHYCRFCRRSWTHGRALLNKNSSFEKTIKGRSERVERGEDANVSSADANAGTSGLENGLGQKGRERRSVESSDDKEEDLKLRKKRKRGRKAQPRGEQMREPDNVPCPRCDSTNTKFVAYNNYKLSQPRYLCSSCCKSWTRGGTIREQRGKKIRRLESSDKDNDVVNSGLEKGGETNNADGNETVVQVANLTDPECAEDSVGEGKREGKSSGPEESEQMNCNHEADGNAHGDNHTGNADANAVTYGLEIGIGRQGRGRGGVENSDDKEKDLESGKNRRWGRCGPRTTQPREPDHAPCPRCDSTNTKFVSYNNYKLSQPRYMCNSCRKSWTRGGIIREKRGKKRRVERSDKEKGIVYSGLEKGGETSSTDGNKMVAQVANLADPDCAEDSERERKMEGERNGSEESEQMDRNGGADGAHGDNHKGEPKIGRGLKGRKRKWVESSVKKVNEVSCGGMAQFVGRILRSNGVEKMVDVGLAEGFLGVTGKKGADVSTKKFTGIENGDSAQLVDRRKRKIKRKVHGKRGPLKGISSDKQNEVRFRENGDQPKSQDVIRGSKFLDNGNRNRLASKLRRAGQKIIVTQSERRKQKERGVRKSTEKQLLRDRIIAMLKSAGWTIDYRPRSGRELGREYFDAVYVSPQGRGLWSVTLAYEILKKQVESGDADSRALAAFSVIPEEELSKLFRITKKKMGLETGLKGQRGGANKKHKGVTQKKDLKKKAANRGTKHKSSDSEHDVPANTLQRGMQRSHRRKRKNGKRCALVVRNSKKGLNPDSEGFELYDGKRSLLSWMIDLGTVPHSGKVRYMNHGSTQALLEGRITREGIHCDCCNETLPLAEFESHAGSQVTQPLQNIYIESGSSLLQCLVDSWGKQDGFECAGIHSVDIDGGDPNDDTCNKCGDGGDLICCDGCPSTFHQSCLNIQKFPSGDWHCVYCSCKFCGMVGGNAHQNGDATGSPLLTCRLCEEKYHLLCIEVNNAAHVNSDSSSFCGEKCQEVFERLQMLLGVKNQLEEGYSWTLCQRFDVSPHASLISSPSKVECNSKLALALSILDECFVPIVDQRSGINLIRNVVYSCGSNFTRLNYTGFFTVILERGDEIISAASISPEVQLEFFISQKRTQKDREKIHGNHLAEMPFIGTRHIYRRQGMCRRLLNAIESALCSLNVEKLVIPAISEMLQTWTSAFGFMPLGESNKKEMNHMNMVVFPGVDMLEKPLLRQKFGGESVISTAGTTPTEHKTEHHTSHGHGRSDIAAAEYDASDVTSETVNFQDSVTIEKCLLSGVTHDNKECENNQMKDSEASGGDALEVDGHLTEGEMNGKKNAHKLSYVSQIASVATKFEGSLDVNGKEVADNELNGEVKAVHLSAEIMTHVGTLPHSKQDVAQIREPEIVASLHNHCFPLGGAFDDTTKPSSEAYLNGIGKSSECHSGVDENDTCGVSIVEDLNRAVVGDQTSCVVTQKDIRELKEEFTATHTGSCSLHVDSLPSRPQISANCSKESENGSQVDSHRLLKSGKLC